MPGTTLTIEQVFRLLTETPPRIAEITNSFTPAQLRTHPGPNEWSANDVLSHLRSCADVWGGCIATLVAETTRRFGPSIQRPGSSKRTIQNWISGNRYMHIQLNDPIF